MSRVISILGSGFSSLSAACYLSRDGYDVTVYEKNSTFGGRASQLIHEGHKFDIGPSWYWMPDVFERFFADFNKKVSDYYQLTQLDPGYQVYFGISDSVLISANLEKVYELFESEESGSSIQLKKFLQTAEDNYNVAVKDLVYSPGVSPLELITPKTINKLNQLFFSIRKQVKKNFSNPRLTKILEFPVLFLGAKPSETPAMYNFMNWADFGLGTWHPNGGMYEVVKGILRLAEDNGVKFVSNAEVKKIKVNKKGIATGIIIDDSLIQSDIVLSGADYHHTEQLLPINFRQYTEKYWDSKRFAPSSLLFYVGFNKKVENVSHHTLFFDVDFDAHASEIYDTLEWPKAPLFYASFPSKTDKTFAPEGKESATFLIPIAIGLEDNDDLREKYFNMIIERLEKLTNNNLKDSIKFKKSYCINDFIDDYNSYKGNAYGLANTLTQTAFLRPRIKSKKVKNLFFTGQLTVPGPGVPPALISGKIASEAISKHFAS
jgi:phytoene desaturase